MTVADAVTARLSEWRELVESTLERELRPESTKPEIIHRAMRYSIQAGGKRLRPLLAIAAAEAIGAEWSRCLKAFTALELIHTYSRRSSRAR
jgi:geranylgeranyl diphosphate synthase, type II